MNYSKFFSATSQRRQGSLIGETFRKMLNSKGKIYPLSVGSPMKTVFPFKNAIFTTKDGTVIKLDEKDMETAQQYLVNEGFPPLLELLRDYQIRLHNPPSSDWTMIMTSGAQEAISLVFDLLINEGDYVISGDHCFSGTLDIFRPLGAKYLAIDQDKHGMIPDILRKRLQEVDPALRNRLKVIYIVSNGGNPESYTLLASRRKEIYQIAREYDLLILEDDPYQFILFDVPSLPLSLLSLDVDGRVLRCDSLSKTISPGFRLGFITASKQLCEKIVFKLQVSSQQANSLTQVVVYKLLKTWGFDGYLRNGQRICEEYKKQKDLACRSAEMWLRNVADWEEPSGGMFMWIRIKGVEDTIDILEKAMKRNAFFAPGRAFRFDGGSSPYIRVSFSNATAEHFDTGFRILAECIQEFKSLRSERNGLKHLNGYANHLEHYLLIGPSSIPGELC